MGYLRLTGWIVLALAIVLAIAAHWVPRVVQDRMNPVADGPMDISAEAMKLHSTLRVADLHADTLLWNRNLNARNEYGHVDFPRLIEGRVALQAFTIVTKVPDGQNYQRNSSDSDRIFTAALVQLWPPRTWNDLTERALFQAKRLAMAADASDGRFRVIRTAEELQQYLDDRRNQPNQAAGFLGLEGAHALEGDLSRLDRLDESGIRMIGITHFFDNAFGGSAHRVSQAGLTELGRQLIVEMESRGILVDIAHGSPQLIDDVLAVASRPVVSSHTGVQATCPGPRNLTDQQVRGIAATGGLIAVGFWPGAVCGDSAAAIVRAIDHVVGLVGVNSVALGSDFDGNVGVPFDTAGLAVVTDELLSSGYSAQDVAAIMGENLIRLMLANLP